MKGKIYILVLLIFFSPLCWKGTGWELFAQRDSVAKALIVTQDTSVPAQIRVKQAFEIIEKAIKNTSSQKDAFAWYVRGVIYKDWYKTFEPQNKKSKIRLDAVVFLKKSIELDTSRGKLIAITENIMMKGQEITVTFKFSSKVVKQTLQSLGNTFYNDLGTLLDTINYRTAIQNYEKFKECMLIADPNYNLRPREVEFKTALADQYGKLFCNNIKTNKKFLREAEITYKAVIALDTNHFNAIYNLAMLYYNYGVDIINSMPLDMPIMEVDKIQDEARENFRKALPYALKAYALNPKKKEVLIALQGIYFSLYEFDKSDEFKIRLQKLEKK